MVGTSYSPRAASGAGGDIEQGLAGPEAGRPPKTPPPQPSPSPWPAGGAARADGHPTHSHRALEARHGRGEASARDLFQASPSRRRVGRRCAGRALRRSMPRHGATVGARRRADDGGAARHGRRATEARCGTWRRGRVGHGSAARRGHGRAIKLAGIQSTGGCSASSGRWLGRSTSPTT